MLRQGVPDVPNNQMCTDKEGHEREAPPSIIPPKDEEHHGGAQARQLR